MGIKIRRFKKLNESLLLESQESKSVAAAKKLWILHFHNCDNFDNNLKNIKSALPILRSKQGGKYILGCTRIVIFDDMFDTTEYNNFNILNNILKIIISSHIDEYDRDLNGLTYMELRRKFGKELKANIDVYKERIKKLPLTGESDYMVVRIKSFEDALKYKDYTNWCITYNKDMWDNYTYDDLNTFYFLLKPGFENIPKVAGENCPNDKYGLSMIAVSVCPDGSINSCTCRWNHDNNATDSQYDYIQLSKLLQHDFFEVLKPVKKPISSKEEKLNDIINNIIGKSVTSLFHNNQQHHIKIDNITYDYYEPNLHIFYTDNNKLTWFLVVIANNNIFEKAVFPEWAKSANMGLPYPGEMGYINNDGYFTSYSLKTGDKIFGPIDCKRFLLSDDKKAYQALIHNDLTFSIFSYDDYIHNNLNNGFHYNIKLPTDTIYHNCLVLRTLLKTPGLIMFDTRFEKNLPQYCIYDLINNKLIIKGELEQNGWNRIRWDEITINKDGNYITTSDLFNPYFEHFCNNTKVFKDNDDNYYLPIFNLYKCLDVTHLFNKNYNKDNVYKIYDIIPEKSHY